MDTSELQGLTVKELQKFAGDLGSTEFLGLLKQDLIKEILGVQAKKKGNIFAAGVLEVLPDGYGFLRSQDYSYLPGPDDIYVSHSQIKRFKLRTGHQISGQVRPPKDNERFFALLRVDSINDESPEKHKNIIYFDNLTPLFPEDHIKLETTIVKTQSKVPTKISCAHRFFFILCCTYIICVVHTKAHGCPICHYCFYSY